MSARLAVLSSLVVMSCTAAPERDLTGHMSGQFKLNGRILTLSERYDVEGDLTSYWELHQREDGVLVVEGAAALTGYTATKDGRVAKLTTEGGKPLLAKLSFELSIDEQGNMTVLPGPPEGTFFNTTPLCPLVFEAQDVAGRLVDNDFRLWGSARFMNLGGCDIQEAGLTFSLTGTRGE